MDSPDTRSSQPLNTAPVTPMLRTVLLCDIVESTALVERLGDLRAVALLKRHDQLLRQLIDFCHGQLIDKADGVLALFERPIQALDFALRYQRGLRELGAVEGLDLKARIGMHVGDVMTWANEPKDVLAGAKAFEVEGLAKPVAARLMNLALPGQILMSGMAQNLCHRAMGELGDASTHLRWLMHGRYNFKGVPAPMLVHEVGEPGLSPLRAPESGAKAWRELPIWRRPPVVALEVVLLGVLGVGLFWSALRSPPAIAFAERDWVVVADLQNRTSEPLFDGSLDAALRVGLEQSRHINLVSELQIDRALERMQRQGQPIDRQLATELALREGAKAVILPTVAEVGGRVRVSLEVVDPGSGVTVYSESADGRGAQDVLPALDATLAKVRSQMGEAMANIESTSRPLEDVTTGNLEALRAFSLAQEARFANRYEDAEALYQQAVALDPTFATAYLRLAFLRYTDNDAVGTRRYLDQAIAHRDHMSQRESLFMDGAEASLSDPAAALKKFKLLATLYPDEYRAYYNYAYFAHNDLLQSAEGLDSIAPAISARNAAQASAQYLAAAMLLSRDRVDEAIAGFEKAEALGVGGYRRDHVEAHMAKRDYAKARKIAQLDSGTGAVSVDLESRQLEVSLPLDRGRWTDAVKAAEGLATAARDASAADLTQWTFQTQALLLRSYAPDDRFAGDLAQFAGQQAARYQAADSLKRRHVIFQALAAGWMSAQSGQGRQAEAMLDLVKGDPLLANYPANAAMARIVAAELALSRGKPGEAIALLSPHEETRSGLYFERAVLMRAHAAAGDAPRALALAQQIARSRGRAFGEPSSLGVWQAANVIENNLALRAAARHAAAMGDDGLADEMQREFEQAWPGGSKLALVRRRDAGP
ncbi:MAG: putative peptide modification system cyclase [Arenimonas sp.]|nr:putative peptide modification system cyclase [Arenimonas sp.]